jgi:hypothetical protein
MAPNGNPWTPIIYYTNPADDDSMKGFPDGVGVQSYTTELIRVGAFAAMRRRLPLLRASEIPFVFIFTLTRNNLHELTGAARFAIDEGDVSLQVHPLEEVGRAAALLRGSRLDECFHELRDHVGVEIALQLGDLLQEEPWLYADGR